GEGRPLVGRDQRQDCNEEHRAEMHHRRADECLHRSAVLLGKDAGADRDGDEHEADQGRRRRADQEARGWRRLGGRTKMRSLRILAGTLAALALGVAAARAQPLTVVEVNAPAVNCVFHPACTITVSDSVGVIPLPYLVAPKPAFLQSRTFSGAAGTPAAGKAGYMYRISLTQAAGSADCLGGLVLNFGPALKLPYAPNKVADVFVITSEVGGTVRRGD